MENIKIIKSKRKTISVEISRDLQVIVRAPIQMKDADIEKFIKEKTSWIKKHFERAKAKFEETESLPKFTKDELKSLSDKASTVIPEKVKYYAQTIGVTYGRITIRKQVSRWGSCSSKNNLNFNCLLMLCPSEVTDYVIIHELCHLLEHNHSDKFWQLVERYCPHYKVYEKWLKENGGKLIRRLR